MNILAIETSCDETAVAVVRDGREVLSSVILSQAETHALYGGVVPEIAARSHLESMSPLTRKALADASLSADAIGAVAVTAAPGLIGALLVGVNYAKGLAMALKTPLVPVHHLRAHIAAAYLEFPKLAPPFIAVIVSGGHTQIVLVSGYTEFRVLGSTRDDAAGEALDKIARVLGLGYPGGAALSKLAERGDSGAFALPDCRVEGKGADMSFSGIKTAAINLLHKAEQGGKPLESADLAASFEKAVTDAIVSRTADAASGQASGLPVVLCGGVAANKRLRQTLRARFGERAYIPPPHLCGDNAAMVGAQGYFEYMAGNLAGWDLNGFANFPVDGEWEALCKGRERIG
ncbi:MAG: tRNA (adenosine(37)-N6)-threonylcarbamoyltransferase complex transferase subunit TsaD [Oscillospiraceae bacterium]|nr:tRNA (adenosine(37)-N6)-threonylcarbamoyltransferase complex transferase subunit TsaD [Oscillospiraceae bacterium]